MKAGLAIAAVSTTLAAIAHSVGGERHMLRPLLAIDAPITQHPIGRPVIRTAWHFTAVLLIVVAITLARAAISSSSADWLVIAVIGVALTAMGIIDGIATKFRHFAWPLQTITGLLVLFSI